MIAILIHVETTKIQTKTRMSHQTHPGVTILYSLHQKIEPRLRAPIPPPNRETKTGHEDAGQLIGQRKHRGIKLDGALLTADCSPPF